MNISRSIAISKFEIAGFTDNVFFRMGPILFSRAFESKINQKMVRSPQNRFSTSVRDGLISSVVYIFVLTNCEAPIQAAVQAWRMTNAEIVVK